MISLKIDLIVVEIYLDLYRCKYFFDISSTRYKVVSSSVECGLDSLKHRNKPKIKSTSSNNLS